MKPSNTVFSLFVSLILCPTSVFAEADGKHLFVLSGQSNMQGHRPAEAFTPAVAKALGKDSVIVVQDAMGGQPIRRWYKGWKSPDGQPSENTDDLNDGVNRRGRAIENDLHYSAEGYKTLGKRFAESALRLIQQHSKSR